jgi:DNA polymerase III, subunit gamma and tau
MYQALYRKWRPKTFDEVVGQEHITEILKKQVLTDRPSHAYLFTGTRGTGKTTCAKLLAKAVNCRNPVGGSPCGQCEICRGIESGSILDVTEMDAASNTGVDDVRTIRDEAVYAPAVARRRVYIIDEVHMLSKAAFNALLKIMEEPPEHLIFILATTELYKVPATILSRCQRYSFRRVPAELIRQRLMQVAAAEDMELTEDAAGLLSRLADGALRDALSLLDQCSGARVDRERVLSAIGLAENEEIIHMAEALLRGDADTALEVMDGLYKGGKDVSAILEQLSALYRDILLGRVAPKNGASLMNGGFSEEALVRLGALADTQSLLRGLEKVQDASSRLDRSGDRRLTAELCLLALASPAFPAAYSAPAAPAAVPVPRPAEAPSAPPPPREEAPAAQKEEAPKPAQPEKLSAAWLSKPEEAPPPAKAEDEKNGVSWEQILAALEEQLDFPEYMMLSNPESLSGALEEGTLILSPKNDTVKSILNADRLALIRRTAEKLTGGSTPVTLASAKSEGEGRFDRLDQFMDKFNIK